jgi:hypothetical protein
MALNRPTVEWDLFGQMLAHEATAQQALRLLSVFAVRDSELNRRRRKEGAGGRREIIGKSEEQG